MDGKSDKEIFQIIFNSINEGVFTTDRDCRITSFNTAAEKISGFSKDEVIGQYCFDIFRTDLCQSQCALRMTIQKGKPINNVRVNILTKSGKSVPIIVSTTVMRETDGEIFGGLEFFRDISEIEELRRHVSGTIKFEDLISNNDEMKDLFRLLPDVAQSECNVLIQGPSGAGKELFARALHNLSPRKNGPYVKVNCAALPDTLLESELFGYVKGAFTDARRDKPGRFEMAKGGTILLDEIGDMSIPLQAKLLRVVQEGEIQPLGSTKTLYTDARIISSTNRDLKKMVESGEFREDLFYRLNVISLSIPPLSGRPEDVQILVDHFVNQFRILTGKNIKGLAPEALDALVKYSFPGNVRELENAVEHAFVLCKDEYIGIHHLPKGISAFLPSKERTPNTSGHGPLELAEAEEIRRTLQKHKGNRSLAARELGLHRTTLWRKTKKFGIVK